MKIVLAALLLAAPAAALAEPPAKMTDAELAAARGGFVLPGGLAINIGVVTDTRIDGALVLRSVYTVTDSARLAVFDGQGNEVAAGAPGPIGVRQLPAGSLISFSGEKIDVGHIVGNAFGTVLANSGDDRAIDLSTTVDLNIAGAAADLLGSAALRVEALALDATARMTR